MARHKGYLDHEKAFEYYNMGLSDAKIAANVGVNPRTILNWRKRMGLPANVCAAKPDKPDKPEKKEKERLAKLSPLARDNEAARAAGMNYGQYKAKLHAEAHPWKGGRK